MRPRNELRILTGFAVGPAGPGQPRRGRRAARGLAAKLASRGKRRRQCCRASRRLAPRHARRSRRKSPCSRILIRPDGHLAAASGSSVSAGRKASPATRSAGSPPGRRLSLARRKDGAWKVGGKTDAAPGSRFVYAAVPELKDGQITAPYLDNRAGVWAALQL